MDSDEIHNQVIAALKEVIDPELHIDVYTLGLIYGVTVTDAAINISMTLTTPLCPYADQIVAAVKASCGALGRVVNVVVTFTPPWEPPLHLRAVLGI
jgi:metal-sulfur cluster biosynthetic enzyme